jgi:hypothetical protein
MEQANGSNTLTDELLKKLTQAEGPCITIVLRADARNDLRTQLRHAVQQVEGKLGGAGRKALLAPLLAETEPVPVAQRPIGSMVILRSPDVFMRFFTPLQMTETVEAGDSFIIRRLLPVVDAGREFYLLALSQNRTRLLFCNGSTSNEVALPVGTPTSLADAMQTRQPDHTLDNRSSAGPSNGAMKGVLFGSSTDTEHKYEDLLKYFHAVDRGVNALLHGLSVPLVAVAVEHELALYRKANTYPHLVEPGVHGSPDGMKGGEMHKRALVLLQSYLEGRVQKALGEFDKSVGTGHATSSAREIVKAAHEGRVSHLFLQDEAEYLGSFDEVRQKVKRHEDEPLDLLNEAAIQTIRHGGNVSVLAAGKMPNGVGVCAVLRYAAVGVAS